jgi:glutamine amidotransferase PdxT
LVILISDLLSPTAETGIKHLVTQQHQVVVLHLLSPEEENPPYHAVFIRAPLIESVGKGVEVLSKLDNGMVVAARQKNLLATAFHPELTPDDRFHRYFVEMSK